MQLTSLVRCSKSATSIAIPAKRFIASNPSWPPERLRLQMEKFQREDGVPVYLKGGVGDRLLVGLTVILLVIGMADGYWTLIKMAFPKKKA